MTTKAFLDVEAFYVRFGMLPEERFPHFPLDPKTTEDRFRFLEEELNELREAFERKDMPAFFDALLDLKYVLLGTAFLHGITAEAWDAGWDEVQRANLAKERVEDDGHKLGMTKPEGWVPPDLARVIQVAFEREFPVRRD